jgi:hypothetical protein
MLQVMMAKARSCFGAAPSSFPDIDFRPPHFWTLPPAGRAASRNRSSAVAGIVLPDQRPGLSGQAISGHAIQAFRRPEMPV